MATKQRTAPKGKKGGPRGGRRVGSPQRSYAFPALIVLLVVAFGVIIFMQRSGGGPSDSSQTFAPKRISDPSSLPGIQKGPAPWSPESSNLDARLQALNFPPLGREQLAFHIHQHLDIYIHGKHEPVPPYIGINDQGLAVLHTHDASGIIHVESPVQANYTLGQLMDVWGVFFTKSCIGEYCDSGQSALHVYVNGKEVKGDPRNVVLRSHEEIVITYGSPAETPNQIPKSYNFPAGD